MITSSLIRRNGGQSVKILHIYKKEPDVSTKKIVEVQKAGNQVKIIDLTKGGVSYDALVDEVFAHDKVYCW